MDDLTASHVPYFNAWVYPTIHRNKPVAEQNSSGVSPMKTIAALVLALSFAAPLAANATTVAQKVQQTYHTSFPGVDQNSSQNSGN
jgi:hypothetical protein